MGLPFMKDLFETVNKTDTTVSYVLKNARVHLLSTLKISHQNFIKEQKERNLSKTQSLTKV